MGPGWMRQAAHDDAAGRHVLKSFSGYRTALSNRPTQLYEELHAAYKLVGVPTNGLAGEHGEGAAVLAG